MPRAKLYIYMFLIVTVSAFCSPERKSASYYYQNKDAINEMRTNFDYLYQQQPFATGFTDKTFKYYVLQIMTDSFRSIYNNEEQKDQIMKNVLRYNYDTTMMRTLSHQMKKIKCLWLGRESYYVDEEKDNFTYISFKSADRVFRENKYYILVFLDHAIDSTDLERIRKRKLVKIDSLVYFTTTNRYR